MRPSLAELLLCLGLSAAVLVSLIWLLSDTAFAFPADGTTTSPALGVEVMEPDQVERVQLRFRNLAGFDRVAYCTWDAHKAKAQEQSFGYPIDAEVVLAELDQILGKKISERSGELAKYLRVDVSHAPVEPGDPPKSWQPLPPRLTWTSLPVDLRQAAGELAEWVVRNLPALRKAIYEDYFHQRGFNLVFSDHVDPDPTDKKDIREIGIAYKRIADRARPLLADCFRQLVNASGESDPRRQIFFFLAMFQEMPSQILESSDGPIYTHGLWLPTQVLRKSSGDCDSKALAFCALQQATAPQLMLLLPEGKDHMYLGIEVPPGPNEKFLAVGNRKFVLCEIAGVAPAGTLDLRWAPEIWPGPLHQICMTDGCET